MYPLELSKKIIKKVPEGSLYYLNLSKHNVKIDKRKDLRKIRCLELPHWNTPEVTYREQALFAADILFLVLWYNGGHQNERLL